MLDYLGNPGRTNMLDSDGYSSYDEIIIIDDCFGTYVRARISNCDENEMSECRDMN